MNYLEGTTVIFGLRQFGGRLVGCRSNVKLIGRAHIGVFGLEFPYRSGCWASSARHRHLTLVTPYKGRHGPHHRWTFIFTRFRIGNLQIKLYLGPNLTVLRTG